MSYYTLPFGASEPIKDMTNQGKAGWGEYYFSYPLAKDSTQPANVILVNEQTENKIVFQLILAIFNIVLPMT